MGYYVSHLQVSKNTFLFDCPNDKTEFHSRHSRPISSELFLLWSTWDDRCKSSMKLAGWKWYRAEIMELQGSMVPIDATFIRKYWSRGGKNLTSETKTRRWEKRWKLIGSNYMSFIDDINKTGVVSHTYLTIEIQNMGNKKFKSVLFLEIMTFEKKSKDVPDSSIKFLSIFCFSQNHHGFCSSQ